MTIDPALVSPCRPIVCSADTLGGAPRLDGTRLPVWLLLAPLDLIQASYPDHRITAEEHAQIAAWTRTPTGRLVLAADLCDRDPERARELLRLTIPLIWASAKTLLLSRFRHHAK